MTGDAQTRSRRCRARDLRERTQWQPAKREYEEHHSIRSVTASSMFGNSASRGDLSDASRRMDSSALRRTIAGTLDVHLEVSMLGLQFPESSRRRASEPIDQQKLLQRHRLPEPLKQDGQQ